MKQNKLSFESEKLVVDYISFNIQGLTDPKTIASNLSKYFAPDILMDDVPSIGFHGLKKKYKVSIRQYTGSRTFVTITECRNFLIIRRKLWEVL